jgi:very-short-patch-repair endonuclease
MKAERWRVVVDHALGQHGLVTTAQVLAVASEAALRRAVAAGLLGPVRRGVHKVAGVPSSEWQPVLAACLAAGASVVASHRAAAGLHRFPGFLPGAVDVTRIDGRAPRLEGARCHATAAFRPDDRRSVLGIPTTCPARTVVDLAGEVTATRLGAVVDHVRRRGLCSPAELVEALERLGGCGRAGAASLRRVLSDRVEGDSDLEARWLRLLRRAGLTPPALQHQVVAAGRVLLLDFAWPVARVGVEVDGWEPHQDRSVWDHDHDKANAYLEAGWRVVFVTSNTAPADVIRQLHRFICR